MKSLTNLETEALRFEDPHQKWVAHIFEREHKLAINAAIAAERPLLLRGDPGTGKTQIARVAAHVLKVPLVSMVLNARSELSDLFGAVDVVARLATAQVLGAAGVKKEDIFTELADPKFTRPGPLWWAFDWVGAKTLGADPPETPPDGWSVEDGCVLLLDEIDKADSAVPNGLLDALGQGEFRGPLGKVRCQKQLPLVLVSTNEERTLPDAFLRRCLVLHLSIDEDNLVSYLVSRARIHFPELDISVMEKAAALLKRSRAYYEDSGLLPPGQAEYLDLLRAVQGAGSVDAQKVLMDELEQYVYFKHGPPQGKK